MVNPLPLLLVVGPLEEIALSPPAGRSLILLILQSRVNKLVARLICRRRHPAPGWVPLRVLLDPGERVYHTAFWSVSFLLEFFILAVSLLPLGAPVALLTKTFPSEPCVPYFRWRIESSPHLYIKHSSISQHVPFVDMKLQVVLFAISAVCVSAACPAGKRPKSLSSAAPTTATVLPSQVPVAAAAAAAEPSSADSEESSSSVADGSSSGSSASVLSAAAVSGTSTFYGGNLNGGTCSFTTMSGIPSGLYGTAFSGSAWNNAAECGSCLEVTGPNGKIKVMVGRPCSNPVRLAPSSPHLHRSSTSALSARKAT